MSYQGPAGPTGVQGPQGCTGQPGLQGTPYGPAGDSYYKNISAITLYPNIVTITTNTYTLNEGNIGSLFVLDLPTYGTITFSVQAPSVNANGKYWEWMAKPFANYSSYTINAYFNFDTSGSPSTSSPGGAPPYFGVVAFHSSQTDTDSYLPNRLAFTVDPISQIQYYVAF